MQESLPLVSVLIPSYNHSLYIRETIASIWKQPYKNIEIVVVDDCSIDSSRDILVELKKTSPLPMTLIFNEKNVGAAASQNIALKVASGEFVAPFASDDLFSDDRLTEAINLFVSQPKLKMVFANGRVIEGDVIKGQLHDDKVKKLLTSPPEKILRFLQTNVSPFFVQTVLIKRDFLCVVGGHDETILADDWLLNLRLFSAISDMDEYAYLDADVAYYRVHDSNVHQDFERQVKLKLEFIEKYSPENLRLEAESNIHYSIAKGALSRGDSALALEHYHQSQSAKFLFNRVIFLWKVWRKRVKAAVLN